MYPEIMISTDSIYTCITKGRDIDQVVAACRPLEEGDEVYMIQRTKEIKLYRLVHVHGTVESIQVSNVKVTVRGVKHPVFLSDVEALTTVKFQDTEWYLGSEILTYEWSVAFKRKEKTCPSLPSD